MRLTFACPSALSLVVASVLAIAPGGTDAQDLLVSRPTDAEFRYFADAQISRSAPRPVDVIGHEIGERFTRYRELIDYLKAVDRASTRAELRQYGWSHQRRPLHVMMISAPENLDRLDEILAANHELADPRNTSQARADEIIESNPSISWLSFNVHGNEASCTEAAMAVIDALAAGEGPRVDAILRNSVIVIDPCLNPDGRERYISWYENIAGSKPNASIDSAEHDEPWPGGRTNHYLFDLNRDWLWLVQVESRQRLKEYRRFMPQYHGDFHEQGYRSPYFFGPGETPYNKNIPDATIEWLSVYGNACAHEFDGRGLVYSTRERFDYLYPGYGKVLPCYHGAVGLLYEQAGHGRGGLSISVSDRYELTLRERAHHHYLTALASIETTATRREDQLRRFWEFFRQRVEAGESGTQSFVISADTNQLKLDRVWSLCDAHGIEIRVLDDAQQVAGLRDFRTGEELETITLPAGSWLIRSDQPMGHLVAAAFERESVVENPDTYDITGWSLPVMFGLEAFYSSESLDLVSSALTDWQIPAAEMTGSGNHALLIDSNDTRFAEAVGEAMRRDLFVRFAGEPIRVAGHDFARGSLIIHVVRNDESAINEFAGAVLRRGIGVHRTPSGRTENGHVLGANKHPIMEVPRVLLLRSDALSSYSFGQHWHLLDVASDLPHTVVTPELIRSIDLDEYNVLVVPGSWSRSPDGFVGRIGDRAHDAIVEWVKDGGTLIATDSSTRWASKHLLELDLNGEEPGESPDGIDDEEREEDPEDRPPLSRLTQDERENRAVEDRVPGAVLSASVDVSHPLAAGMRTWIGIIKLDADTLPVSENAQVIARFDELPLIGGSISQENIEKVGGTPLVALHRLGSGKVVCFNDDPTMRGFNHEAMRLLLNAIIFGPSL